MTNSKILYSHRPMAGVSVGVYREDDKVYVAAAFANNGLSCSGKLRKNYIDPFSRATARDIISGRIKVATSEVGSTTEFVADFNTEASEWEIMQKLRDEFKPDPYENDQVLAGDANGRMNTRKMWAKIIMATTKSIVMLETDKVAS